MTSITGPAGPKRVRCSDPAMTAMTTERAGFQTPARHRPDVVVGATDAADVRAAVAYAGEQRAAGRGPVHRPRHAMAADGGVLVSTRQDDRRTGGPREPDRQDRGRRALGAGRRGDGPPWPGPAERQRPARRRRLLHARRRVSASRRARMATPPTSVQRRRGGHRRRRAQRGHGRRRARTCSGRCAAGGATSAWSPAWRSASSR